MGQSFSEYLYYEPDQEYTDKESPKVVFEEDCLITTFQQPDEFKPLLETINENTEITNEIYEKDIDAHSKEYVKNIFLIAKEVLDSGKAPNNENFDISYPITLTNIVKETPRHYLEDYSNLKAKHKSLEWDHEVLKNKYETLRNSYDLLNKNYKIIKNKNLKYKFD